ncbi:MAG: GAF domain-containing sensor histidine kinase [Anaerolineaceae bacterium]|nr:MAG: GAF domain-containing sensor histidine kinase [Anaerolineaceae bacterium]
MSSDRSAREISAITNYPRLLKRYARLLEIASELVSMLDLNTLLQHIVDAAQELTESEGASLLLYDPQTHHLYFQAATGPLNEQEKQTAIPAESSIAGWIFTNNEPLLVEDAMSDPRFFREVDVLTHFKTRSILGVPLLAKDKTLGVIEVVNKLKGTFEEMDLRLLQSLAAQAAIAIENSRLFQQSDLVAEMVHELRTPLAALTAAAHLIQRPELEDDQREKLSRTMYSEVQRLNEMATDFLDIARLESGRISFVREPVHLEGLIRECLEIIRPQAEAERITLATEIDRSLEPVLGDRNRLKQLLLNLLTNAIKYNRQRGQVLVTLRNKGDELLLSVKDTGKGIPPESLPRVFDRFYRVPAQESGTVGSGLGLAIAQTIAKNHHGIIEVESVLDQGSTFTLRLPHVKSAIS